MFIFIILIKSKNKKKTIQNPKPKNDKDSVLIFLLIVFITSLRYEINYHSYYFYTYLFFLVFCLERLDDKIVNIILVFCLIFTIYNNFFVSKDKYSEIFNRVSNLDFICISENTDKKISTIDTLKYWHSKINDKTIKKLCKYNSLN